MSGSLLLRMARSGNPRLRPSLPPLFTRPAWEPDEQPPVWAEYALPARATRSGAALPARPLAPESPELATPRGHSEPAGEGTVQGLAPTAPSRSGSPLDREVARLEAEGAPVGAPFRTPPPGAGAPLPLRGPADKAARAPTPSSASGASRPALDPSALGAPIAATLRSPPTELSASGDASRSPRHAPRASNPSGTAHAPLEPATAPSSAPATRTATTALPQPAATASPPTRAVRTAGERPVPEADMRAHPAPRAAPERPAVAETPPAAPEIVVEIGRVVISAPPPPQRPAARSSRTTLESYLERRRE